MDKRKIYILASASPRRIEMMRSRGIEPIILPASIEENIPPVCGMRQTVMFLALKKAKAAEAEYLKETGQARGEAGSVPEAGGMSCMRCHIEAREAPAEPGACDLHGEPAVTGTHVACDACDAPIIIAADTIVYKDGIMGKPKDRADARRMLSSLAAGRHYVVTGCALLEAGSQNGRVFAEVTEVFVKPLSEEALDAYLDTDEPYDKAGAYAIQGLFAAHIDHIDGDYDNVVGLPWARIEEELQLL